MDFEIKETKMKLLHLSRLVWIYEARLTVYEAFCGDTAKYEALCVLHASGVSSAQKHEAALRAMKQSLTASFRHFFAKKMAVRFQNQHPQSETWF